MAGKVGQGQGCRTQKEEKMSRVVSLMAIANAQTSFLVDNVWYEMTYHTLKRIEQAMGCKQSNKAVVHYIHQHLPQFEITEHNPTGRALFVYVKPR